MVNSKGARKRVEAFYSGMVQGVGFRFTAESFAIDLGIYGGVKNLADGRVQVVAEAEEDTLKEFLGRLKQYFSHHIKSVDISWQEATGEFRDFQIRF